MASAGTAPVAAIEMMGSGQGVACATLEYLDEVLFGQCLELGCDLSDALRPSTERGCGLEWQLARAVALGGMTRFLFDCDPWGELGNGCIYYPKVDTDFKSQELGSGARFQGPHATRSGGWARDSREAAIPTRDECKWREKKDKEKIVRLPIVCDLGRAILVPY